MWAPDTMWAQGMPSWACMLLPKTDDASRMQANQCSFGETYRKAKRGGQYVATVATIPRSSIYVSLSFGCELWPARTETTMHGNMLRPSIYVSVSEVVSCWLACTDTTMSWRPSLLQYLCKLQ